MHVKNSKGISDAEMEQGIQDQKWVREVISIEGSFKNADFHSEGDGKPLRLVSDY